ncbi:putative esterase [Aureobasidium subglaciale]|nr:putative esterase [Aureobasidium subglaciale]
MLDALIATPPCGPIQGFKNGLVIRYTGIPYARASRFEVPQSLEPWTKNFQATSPCPACPQPSDKASGLISKKPLLSGLKISEDCQCLSITVPDGARVDEKLPVMIWVYGGSFSSGAADSPAYDPSRLVSEHRVIVVNINYRLNLFGFLGDGKKKPANLGLLDQLDALRWVRRNIAAFGGDDDPKTITFFGQSAGGSSVADLMAVPEASSLFGRAIVQSAPFGITRGRDALNETLLKVAESATVNSSTDELVALCEAIDKAGSGTPPMGGMPFAPQYGHAPLPAEQDVDAALDKVAPQIDLLVGSTDHEASLFVGFMPVVGSSINLPFVGRKIHDVAVSKVTEMLYQPFDKKFAKRHAKAGGKASLYRIHWSNKKNRFGATHTIELPLLFGDKDVWAGAKTLEGFSAQEIETAGKQMRKIWADFAKGKQVDSGDGVRGLLTIELIGM